MMNRIRLLSCGFFAVALLLFAKGSITAAPEPDLTFENAEFESGPGSEPAVSVSISLSKIPQQHGKLPAETNMLQEDEEEQFSEEGIFPEDGPPVILPQHSLQEDHSIPGPGSFKSAGASASASGLLTSFPAIGETNRGNLDPILAAGPKHIMVAVNPVVAIYTKKGRRRFQTDFKSWFAALPVARTAHLFDPKLIYDQYDGHYIFMCDSFTKTRAWFLISVSKTSDPEGEWVFYALDMQLNGSSGRVNYWADFPRIGFDQDAVYLTAGMYSLGYPVFHYAKIRVLKKSELYSFGPLNWYDFWNLKEGPATKAINIEPAHSYGTATAGYLISINAVKGSKLTLWKITNAASSTPILRKRRIAVTSYQAPPAGEQKGGGTVINRGCLCVLRAVLMNGTLYTAFSTAYDWGAGTVAALRYYEIGIPGSIIQEITYGQKTSYYLFPVVMPDQNGNVLILFNRSSPQEYAGIFFTGRKSGDRPGKLQASDVLQPGLANYRNPFAGSIINHWGDYNGIALDLDNSLWMYSEYAKRSDERENIVGHFSW